VRGARLEIAVDPELEDTIALAGIVHPDPRLDAIPLAHVRGIEERRLADLRPEPAEVGEVVVFGRADVPLRIRPRGRVEDQVVVPSAAAPDVRDERPRPVRTGEDNCPGQLVAAAARPPRLVAQIEAPVDLPVVGRTAVDRPEVRVRRPAEGQLQRARVDVARVKACAHGAGAAHADPGGPDEAAAAAVVLEILPEPVLVEVVTPDPPALRPRALVDQTRGAAAAAATTVAATPGHGDLGAGALAVARDRDRR